MNLTTATPSEIDAVYAEIHWRRVANLAEINRQRIILGRYHQQKADYAAGRTDSLGHTRAAETRTKERLSAARNAARTIAAEIHPFVAEFARRMGWHRAFLVNNQFGHVHKSMNCKSCYPTTSFTWMTEYSGLPEAEIVEAAGERACTVCYPSAPDDILSRPTRMFSPKEHASRAAREANRENRERSMELRARILAARAIAGANGEELLSSTGNEITTVTAAWHELISELARANVGRTGLVVLPGIERALIARFGEEAFRETRRKKVMGYNRRHATKISVPH